MTTVSYSIYPSFSTAAVSPAITITLIPASGTTVHDVTLIITPLQGGEFAVFLSAQGLQPGAAYLIEGIANGVPTSIVPLALTAPDSEFVADNEGNGVYSYVLTANPQTVYSSILLLYLPNNQVAGSVLVASANLG